MFDTGGQYSQRKTEVKKMYRSTLQETWKKSYSEVAHQETKINKPVQNSPLEDNTEEKVLDDRFSPIDATEVYSAGKPVEAKVQEFLRREKPSLRKNCEKSNKISAVTK